MGPLLIEFGYSRAIPQLELACFVLCFENKVALVRMESKWRFCLHIAPYSFSSSDYKSLCVCSTNSQVQRQSERRKFGKGTKVCVTFGRLNFVVVASEDRMVRLGYEIALIKSPKANPSILTFVHCLGSAYNHDGVCFVASRRDSLRTDHWRR